MIQHIVWVFREEDGYNSPVVVRGAADRQDARRIVEKDIKDGKIKAGTITSIAEVRYA